MTILDFDLNPIPCHPRPLGKVAQQMTFDQVSYCIDLWIDCPMPVTEGDITLAGGEFDRGVLYVLSQEDPQACEVSTREWLSRQGRQEMHRLIEFHKAHSCRTPERESGYDLGTLTDLHRAIFKLVRELDLDDPM